MATSMPKIGEGKGKSFWEKPEGTTGMLFMAGGIIGVGVLLYKFLPHIITLLQNIYTAGALGLGLAAILYVLMDKKFQTLVSVGYKSLMKALTGMFIELNPIAIIEIYVEDLKKNIAKMNAQISRLRGQMKKLMMQIEENEKVMKQNLALANEAQKKNKQNIMVLKSRKAGRLQNSNVTLNKLHNKLEVLYRVLLKMYENANIVMEDTQDEVNVKKTEYETIRTASSAFRSAMSVINGNPDQKALFDQTMEHIADDVGNRIGEMEHFMEVSQTFMESIDLQNGVFEEQGLQMLEKWEKESGSILLGDVDKQQIIAQSNDERAVLDIDGETPITVGSGSSKDGYFS